MLNGEGWLFACQPEAGLTSLRFTTVLQVMVAFIDQYQDRIERVCQRFGVKRLEAFGSVLRNDFGAGSDVDFVVEFDHSQPDAFDQYFGLKEALESLVGRPVDLVVADAIRNPYFRVEVQQTKMLVYVAA
jgi:hypothetical protein